MKEFKDYLKNSKEKSKALTLPSLALPSSTAIANVIVSKIALSPSLNLSKSEVSEFSNKVSELAVSDEVINELSFEVGLPKKHETEDEFVNRAKSSLRSILKRKLSK